MFDLPISMHLMCTLHTLYFY